MLVVISIETVVLALMAVLVAGLLRSHAEILRRLEAFEGDPHAAPSSPALAIDPTRLPPRTAAVAADVSGRTPAGDAASVAVGRAGRGTLLAFLSSGCASCGAFWEAFDPARRDVLPGGTRLVVVTRGPDRESPSKLRGLAPPDVPVVMSSQAWADYQVPMTPYFVLVDGASGRIAGEGVAEGWPQLSSLVRDALAEAPASGHGEGGTARSSRADGELRAAGIGPGHPSLYGPQGRT